MRKAGVILFFLLICIFSKPILLAAQEDPEFDPDWDYYTDDLFSQGDQTFIITLGTIFPTLFFYKDTSVNKHNFSPPIGGTGSLAYNYYLTKYAFVGAEVSFMFISTLGNNTIFIIPLGLRGGYQFNFWRLEFPVNLALGMVWHRYLSLSNYSLYVKGGGSAFFRATFNWSYGVNLNWFWFPQWIRGEKDKNVHGHMLDITLSARYHF